MLTTVVNTKHDRLNPGIVASMDLKRNVDFSHRVAHAIIDLHENGFTEDFILAGNGLLWVQEKTCLQPTDFYMIKSHRFDHPDKKQRLFLMGIMITPANVKGIGMYEHLMTTPLPAMLTAIQD
ncbi:MAG: hypothetical protein JWQ27_277 [Ferruginibacter sp.]|nr:hypothetical protein [Ferruginibacter sp.]